MWAFWGNLNSNTRKVILAILAIAVLFGGIYFWHWANKTFNPAPITTQVTQADLQNTAALMAALKENANTIEKLKKDIANVSSKPPEVSYYVSAPTVQAAADKVEQDIKNGTSPANGVPADNTIVTPNTNEQKVDVYRIQMDKPKLGINAIVLTGGKNGKTEAGVGPSWKNKDTAINAGYTTEQRTYIMGVHYF